MLFERRRAAETGEYEGCERASQFPWHLAMSWCRAGAATLNGEVLLTWEDMGHEVAASSPEDDDWRCCPRSGVRSLGGQAAARRQPREDARRAVQGCTKTAT